LFLFSSFGQVVVGDGLKELKPAGERQIGPHWMAALAQPLINPFLTM